MRSGSQSFLQRIFAFQCHLYWEGDVVGFSKTAKLNLLGKAQGSPRWARSRTLDQSGPFQARVMIYDSSGETSDLPQTHCQEVTAVVWLCNVLHRLACLSSCFSTGGTVWEDYGRTLWVEWVTRDECWGSVCQPHFRFTFCFLKADVMWSTQPPAPTNIHALLVAFTAMTHDISLKVWAQIIPFSCELFLFIYLSAYYIIAMRK